MGAGLTQRSLAEKCSVHPTTILRLEVGKLCPNDELKWKIAGVLGLRMDLLWAWPRIVPPAPDGQRSAA
jgi:DNA-binding XRE family transcriptional regulator